MITCHKCKRELPENAFYTSSLNRGYVFCKDCCKKWNREAKKRYLARRKAIKNYKETKDLNTLMGGFVLSMLYTPKANEFKFCLRETGEDNRFFTNSESVIRQLFEKALATVTKDMDKQEDGKKTD